MIRLPASFPSAQDQRAIIDIGSNTVRLVIYGGPARAPVVLFNEKVTARLGKGVAESGMLSAKGIATALGALARFAMILKLRGVDDVQTVATAAARDAANGGEFLMQVAALGLSPRLLSGEEEAVASARGVLSAFPGACGIVADLGGGSLELIDIEGDAHGGGRCTHGVTLPLGTLRLAALRAEGNDKFARRIHRMLKGQDWDAHSGQVLYLVGGSLRAFARFAMEQVNWPIDDPHAYELSPEEVLSAVRALQSKTARGGTLAPISGVSGSRLASLADAGALLGQLVKELHPSRVIFSGWGLREGLLAGAMGAKTAGQDPLLAGVIAFVDTQQPGLSAAADLVARWSGRLGYAGPDNLRRAAVMLALASLRSEPNLRAEQAAQWALRKRWLGVDEAGRAMIAMAVLANSGQAEIPTDLPRLAPLQDLREAVIWGMATRLARRFCAGAGEVLEASSLTISGRKLVLATTHAMAPLYTDACAKDLRVLAEMMGLTPHRLSVETAADLP
ncbi:Ppx/GppA phosphatase family protein [Novosphingobium sp. KACC 22771]|uniref:Ppx/GppA phosphatase family protein n=1 Tax=Novosphingobium sp. KACC 22771 TaxID=3025670 RepID=UPI002365ADD0|nr:exopolyphosphatase [Novosphingobium sp. KACC 22771]WDF71937.1 exopolyphosphatase [Novosphingobium sp. KACC 22771]